MTVLPHRSKILSKKPLLQAVWLSGCLAVKLRFVWLARVTERPCLRPSTCLYVPQYVQSILRYRYHGHTDIPVPFHTAGHTPKPHPPCVNGGSPPIVHYLLFEFLWYKIQRDSPLQLRDECRPLTIGPESLDPDLQSWYLISPSSFAANTEFERCPRSSLDGIGPPACRPF